MHHARLFQKCAVDCVGIVDGDSARLSASMFSRAEMTDLQVRPRNSGRKPVAHGLQPQSLAQGELEHHECNLHRLLLKVISRAP